MSSEKKASNCKICNRLMGIYYRYGDEINYECNFCRLIDVFQSTHSKYYNCISNNELVSEAFLFAYGSNFIVIDKLIKDQVIQIELVITDYANDLVHLFQVPYKENINVHELVERAKKLIMFI